MIEIYKPKLDDLWFREMLMNDEETMAYNHAWGGTIPFPKVRWNDWYRRWVIEANDCFYRYLKTQNTNEFVGEIAYHYDGEMFIANIIIYSKYRGLGYGKDGLNLLCECAKQNGVNVLYDDIAIDNPAITLFKKCGFEEEYKTSQIVMLRKKL